MLVFLLVVILLAAARPALAVIRFARLPRAAKRHYPLALWARFRWRWMTRALGLSYIDQHKKAVKPVPFGTSVKVDKSAGEKAVLRFPRAKIRADAHGLVATVRTVPKVGRGEFEDRAEHIANAWRCQRVSVSQSAPGRLVVRGMKVDPLLAPFGLEAAPPARPGHIWLGRDDHGADRWLGLANLSGIVVGGQPGGGKSQAITSWEVQLAPDPAMATANHDGKGAGEFDDLAPRAWLTCGDSIGELLASLEELTGLMYERLASVRDFTGGRKNIWTPAPGRPYGVCAEWPCQFSVFDETQTWFDLPAAKALGKEAEKDCAQAIKLASELVRKGRSAGFVSVFGTQKPTSDSLPSAISSNCALSVGFSLKTLDAAKATLGADIGNYPALSPVALSLPDYAGVAVVSVRDGMVPFSRIRSPLITEDQAAAAAAQYAHLRRSPVTLLPVTVPDDVSELVTGR